MADEEEKNLETTDEVSGGGGEGGVGGSEASTAAEPAATSEPEPEGGGREAEQPSVSEESEAEQPSADVPAEPDPLDDLPRKERNRILKSRRPHKALPTRTPEERQAERDAERKRKATQRAKRRAEAKAATGTDKGTGTPPAQREPNLPKTRQGVVVSDKADKTITVRIDIARRHPVYEKIVRRSRTLSVHDERNEAAAGDTVRVIETRPLSKTKRWRLVEIMEKAR